MTAPANPNGATRGVLAAALCYLTWGLVPLYWHLLTEVSALELVAHRLVWSLVFVTPLLCWLGGWAEARAALGTRRGFAVNLLSSALLTGNWLVYVWGVNHGHVIECSLGYFLVPLLNVALGRWVLRERLRPIQTVAIGCAALGVAIQVVQVGRLPWIALTLAVTFGFYGLLRKRSALGPLTGLAVETALLAPFALALLLWRHHTGEGALGHASSTVQVLVLSTGVVTAIPLLLFAYGARRIRLTTLGLLQYIAPTVQFTLGVAVFHEPFARTRALPFGFIWAGLVLYTVHNVFAHRRNSPN
ncbi:MAG: EamA family transporter RarD [Undibacterium sp.]|nr:EamA family transporter RarD [Opitutaceae bacterium]